MAYNQNPFGNMTPEQKLGATYALTQALSWINQPLSGSSQASAGNGTEATILSKTTRRAKSTTTKGTRGGTSAQHAQAGHEGGIATAKRKVGRKSNAERALLSQQAQS